MLLRCPRAAHASVNGYTRGRLFVAGRQVRGNPCRRWRRRLRNGGGCRCDGRARVTVIQAKPTKSVGKAERRELPGLSKTTESEAIESIEKARSGLNESETIESKDVIVEMMVGDHDHSIVVGAHDNSHRRPPVHAPSGFRWGSQCNQRETKNCKSNQCAHVAPSRTISLILMRERQILSLPATQCQSHDRVHLDATPRFLF